MGVDIKISSENLLKWSDMEDWSNGTSVAPTEHTLSTGSIARESTIIKSGTYSAKVTRTGADVSLYHDIPDYTDYQNRKMTFGCWVYATVASRGRIALSDGVGSTNSSYHTGGSGWEFIEVTHDVSATATRVRIECHVNTGATAVYFDGGVLVEGSSSMFVFTDSVDISGWTPSNRFKGQTFKAARRKGSIIPTMLLDSKSIRVKGMALDSTPTLTRALFDTVLKNVNSEITKHDGSLYKKDLYLFDDRKLPVLLKSVKETNDAALTVIKFDLDFIAPDGFHVAPQRTRSKTTIDSSPKTITVNTTGTAQTFPIITVTAGSADITAMTIQNLTSDQSFSFSDTVTSGEVFIMDVEKLELTNNAVDSIGSLTGDSQTVLFTGDNNFVVTITGGSTDSIITIDWSNRWL